jgi:hypothetical protein
LQNTAGVVLEMKIESALRTIHVLLKEGPNIEPHNLSEMLLKIQTQLVDASEVAGSVSSPWRLDEI